MGKPADDIIEEQIQWAQDKIIYTAIEHITDSFDSFPGIGIGLSFMKRSAEKMIVKRLENEIVPDIDDHFQLQMAYVQDLVDADDADAVEAEYRERLLDNDPFLQTLDAPGDEVERIRSNLWEKNREMAERAASWITATEGETFEDYADMAVFLDLSVDTVVDEIREMLHHVDLLEENREHVDMSGYSSVLEHSKVHAWFLDALIEGLQQGRQDVIDEVRKQIAERQELE